MPAQKLFPFLSPCTISTRNDRNLIAQIPTIDLLNPNSRHQLVKACQDFGFFKVVNHKVPTGFIRKLEDEAIAFFGLPLSQKHRAGSPSPFGYGNKQIGRNGDVGWLEYLLLSSAPQSVSDVSLDVYPDNPQKLSCAVNNYLLATKKMTCHILESLAEGLELDQNDAFSKMLEDEESDSCFRMNHYPPTPFTGGKVLGFGEHTDPQIVSVLRSNDACGFEISVEDGKWLPVAPDPNSFFFLVGDSLQVMSNGRFRSVKHRVMAQGSRSRISMIFFGGPPPNQKIAPLQSLMKKQGEESLYKEFTWKEYKMAAYNTRLADYRLGRFEKKG